MEKGAADRDDVPVGGKSREEEHGKDTQVWSPSVGTTNALNPGYCIKQHNIVIDVLGGYLRDVSQALRDLGGETSSKVVRRMQKSVITSTLHIAGYVKIIQSSTTV